MAQKGETNRQIAGDVALDYVKRFKDVSSRELGRKLYAENKLIFASPESAYVAIRYYRGETGQRARKSASNYIQYFRDKVEPLIPASDSRPYLPFIIPKQYKRGLLLFDLHVPYHDHEAVMTALEGGYNFNIDFIVIAGDGMDCHFLSKFCKDPRKRRFLEEVAIMKKYIAMLKQAFGKIKIYYKYGNHEERYDHYIMQHAAEIYDKEKTSLDVELDLTQSGVEWIDEQRLMHFGYLTIAHGHEWGGGQTNPVNPARGLFMRGNEIATVGHYHQTSEHTQTDLREKVITCWSSGCLCELHPEYRRLNKWNHGFQLVERTTDSGGFVLQNKRIIKGCIV